MGRTRYEFRVSGRLCPDAQAAFGDMDVSTRPRQTIIRGPVDGARLSDVLGLIRDLGLRVVSVQQLPEAAHGAHPVQDGSGSADRP